MRISMLFALLVLGCDDSGPITHPDDAGATDAVADVPVSADASIPDGGCASNTECTGDGGSRYLRCIDYHCRECRRDSDCTGNPIALGPRCAGHADAGTSLHCVCGSADGGTLDCAGNPNGPVCQGVPGFCGCTAPSDCPSGSCVPDDYVGGSLCAP
jgi:hypothetical protein